MMDLVWKIMYPIVKQEVHQLIKVNFPSFYGKLHGLSLQYQKFGMIFTVKLNFRYGKFKEI